MRHTRRNDPDVHREGHTATAVAADDRSEGVSRLRGLDIPGSLAGMLAAIALELILFAAVAAAAGAALFEGGRTSLAEAATTEAAIGGAVAAVIIMFLAFFVGGWAAGRIARFDGVLNGAMTAVWALVLAAILAGIGALVGAEYNLFETIGVSNFFGQEFGVASILFAIAAVAAMLLGGALGGAVGERSHRAHGEDLRA